MITFKSIHIEGFCSIQKLDLDLNTNMITIIRGANGLGKSTIFSAIVWAIYGKNIKGNPNVNTWDKVRPKDYKGTKVELFFSDDNNHTHKIIRCLEYKGEVEGSRGNNRLIYQIDAESVKEKAKKQIEDRIIKSLGMSYQLFLNSVMFGQGLERLVNESGSQQKDIFEEMLNLEYLSVAKGIAYDKYKSLESEKRDLDSKLNTLNNSISYITRNIENLGKAKDEINNRLSDSISESKKLIKSFKDKLSEVSEELDKYNPDDITNKLHEFKSEIQTKNKELLANKKEIGIPLEDLVDEIIKLLEKNKIEDSLNKLRTLKKAFRIQSVLKDEINKLNNLIDKYSRDKAKISSLNNQASFYHKNIKEQKDKISELKAHKEEPEDNQEDLSSLKKELEVAQKKVDTLLVKIERVNRDLEVYKWAYTDPLGNNGIKAYLFESSLGFLNDTLESYSDILGFRIQFNIDLQGNRKDFVTKLLFEGQEVPYDDLSGGQKQLVNLAIAFAMNTTLNNSKGVNISFLDEVFESLSSDNIELVISLIRKIYKGKTLFLISHHENLPIPNSRVLKVTRVKGISQYQF